MAAKRSLALDPEYDELPNPLSGKRMKIIEERRNKAKLKIQSILEIQFDKEVQDKEDEVDKCDDVLYECRCKLDRLRACIVAKYYSVSTVKNQLSFEKQLQKLKPTSTLSQKHNDEPACGIHPAVKMGLGEPLRLNSPPFTIKTEENVSDENVTNSTVPFSPSQPVKLSEPDENQVFKNWDMLHKAPRCKTKLQLAYGNVSKYIPPMQRRDNDELTHIWKAYIRESKGYPKLSNFVKKVCFYLHPSFRPNDVIEISNPPYEITRHGWGDFPIRMQLHFHDSRNKPIDLIHNLKLDKTYTGLTMLGPEVHAELLVYNVSTAVPSPRIVPKSFTWTNNKMSLEPSPSAVIHHHTPLKHILQRLPSSSKASEIHSPLIKREEQATSQPIVVNSPLTSNSLTSTALASQSLSTNSAVMTSSQLKNGMTAFVKCTDSQGRTLLVPQSSLICISSSSNSGDSTLSPDQNHRISHTSSILHSKLTSVSTGLPILPMKQSPTKISNSNLPLYILKPAITQQNGVNQILLISANDDKSKVLEVSAAKKKLKSCVTTLNGYTIAESPSKAVVTAAENSLVKHKPRLHWEKLLQDVDTSDCSNFTHILRKVLKSVLRLKQDAGALPFPFAVVHTENKSWNIGKTRAAEWQFAGLVRTAILKILLNRPNKVFGPDSVWTRKKIMLHCRKHGYTSLERTFHPSLKTFDSDSLMNGSLCSSDDLLQSLENGNNSLVPAFGEMIDVCHDTKKEVASRHPYIRLIGISHSSPTALYLKQCASEILVNMKPVELEPGVAVPVIEEMMLSACKEFISDIIRAAVNASYNRMGGKICPPEVTIWDVYLAILGNQDFEFLTNKYLGVLNEQFIKR